jgi:hypothetical protein
LIDGEAIVCDENGLAVFELIRVMAATRPQSFAPSICSNLTEKICGGARSRSEKVD